jgi:serine/threonine protein kinase
LDTNNRAKRNRLDSLRSWQIPTQRIQVNVNDRIGQGSFGTVYKGNDLQNGVVAVKFLSNVSSKDCFDEFKNEVLILQTTEHENVLTFIGCLLNENLAIVTEWCPGSSLYNHIHNYSGYDDWKMLEIIDIAKQVAAGMEYLHNRNIIHCDLKSNNIFLVPLTTSTNSNGVVASSSSSNNSNCELKWRVKIGDFGVAKVKSAYEQQKAKRAKLDGSILWMAPEIIIQKEADPYTKLSDVYSFGVVLYELTAGRLPFINADNMDGFGGRNLHMVFFLNKSTFDSFFRSLKNFHYVI